VVSVEVVASTVLGIETTVFAIAVAVYIMLRQGSEFTITDRVAIALVGRRLWADDIADKMTMKAFGWAYLMLFTGMGYLPGMVFGIWGWLTDNIEWVVVGIFWFIPAVFGFIYGVTVLRKVWKDKILKEVKEELRLSESKKLQGDTP